MEAFYRHWRGPIFKIFSNHSRMTPKFQHYLHHFLIQVQKMAEIGIGYSRFQITWGTNNIFPPKYLYLPQRLKKLCIWINLQFPLLRIKNVYFLKGLSTQVSSFLAGLK